MDLFNKMKMFKKLRGRDIEEEIERIELATKAVDPGSDEYRRLREAYEQELKNKKLVREMRFLGIPAEKIMMACLILIIAGFGFALDMESPKALKISTFILNIIKKV